MVEDNPLAIHPELAALQVTANERAKVQEAPKEEPVTAPTAAGHNRPASKYTDPEKLAEGYDHQFFETQRIIAENNATRERLAATERLLEVAMSNREQPGVQPVRTPLPQDVSEMSIEQLYETVVNAVGTIMKPLTEGIAARENLAQTYPDFLSLESQVDQFLTANPSLKARYEEKRNKYGPAEAFEYGLLAFKANNPSFTPPPDPTPSNFSGREEQGAARRDGENLAAGSGRQHSDPEGDANTALQAAYDAARAVGFVNGSPEMTKFLRLRFAGTSVAPATPQR